MCVKYVAEVQGLTAPSTADPVWQGRMLGATDYEGIAELNARALTAHPVDPRRVCKVPLNFENNVPEIYRILKSGRSIA